jgi:aspartate carbamoyltransferase catalytic subunit
MSLLDIKSLTAQQIEEIFSLAQDLQRQSRPIRQKGESVILAFFEASTRTRLSFETAAIRVGMGTLVFDGGMKTSLEKGETIEDSILNMAAMQPKLMVIRCGDEIDLLQISRQIQIPVLNAGWGVQGHPTQALLDQLTLKTKWGKLEGKKLLIIGDLKHSRVAASHLELCEKTGIELAQCGPQELLRTEKQIKTFSSLQEGLRWADAVMALRFQTERYESNNSFSPGNNFRQFALTAKVLNENLPGGAWILHPGPINHGVEMDSEILADPRSLVLEQVRQGVFLREAVLRKTLGENL